jgi:hypothetical protein
MSEVEQLMRQPATGELQVEWSSKVNGRQGLMVPYRTLSNFSSLKDAGFRSVYLFDKTSADEIKALGNSQGFSRFTVWSDMLIVDIDSGDQGLVKVLNKLDGLAMEVYSSGSKGYHIHIPHDLVGGPVPEAHQQFLESRGIADGETDFSLYRPNSIVALPGRLHPKTGRKKTLIFVFDGERPTMPNPYVIPKVQHELIATEAEQFRVALYRVLSLLEQEPKQGKRHTALWSTAGMLRDAGFDQDTALTMLTKLSSLWLYPKDTNEVERAVSQAYAW